MDEVMRRGGRGYEDTSVVTRSLLNEACICKCWRVQLCIRVYAREIVVMFTAREQCHSTTHGTGYEGLVQFVVESNPSLKAVVKERRATQSYGSSLMDTSLDPRSRTEPKHTKQY